MKTSGDTLLITGGGSGIGRALAQRFHARGDRVIIAGRDLTKLEATVEANPGMELYQLDVADPQAIRRAAEDLTRSFPDLNGLINDAGVMIAEDLTQPQSSLAHAEATVAINLLGPIRMIAAFLPHLQRQERATILNVSSGLAFVPLTSTPTYCATKAAIHSYTVSLRRQLEGSGVEVLELVPPAVQTDLMPGHRNDPRAMPLDAFIDEVMALLELQPTPPEIAVERVQLLRSAEAEGRFGEVLEMLNPQADAA